MLHFITNQRISTENGIEAIIIIKKKQRPCSMVQCVRNSTLPCSIMKGSSKNVLPLLGIHALRFFMINMDWNMLQELCCNSFEADGWRRKSCYLTTKLHFSTKADQKCQAVGEKRAMKGGNSPIIWGFEIFGISSTSRKITSKKCPSNPSVSNGSDQSKIGGWRGKACVVVNYFGRHYPGWELQ